MDKKAKQSVRTKLEILDLKRKANKMYLTGEFTAKQIAKNLNVSEKSIGRWINGYGWTKKKEDALYVREPAITMVKLKSILKKIHPELVETIEKVFKEISKPKA